MAGFETILLLLLGSIGLALLARKLTVPLPIMMVIGGLAVALVPGLPAVQLDPDLTFAIFVPPLLFRAALTTSLRGLKANLRAVTLLATGLVVATAAGVALVAHRFLALPWDACFVLGAILSPPDAVVAISLARSLRIPRRAISVIEGETLLNDTTAFVLFRQAVRATETGSYSLAKAVPQFLLVGLGGAALGYVVYRFVRWARQSMHEPVLENVVWLLVPFLAFLPAEALGASGVLAVVVAGVLLRKSSPLRVSPQTRIQANHAYDLLEYMLNSLIFILIGMEVGLILRDPNGPPMAQVLRSTALVAGAVVIIRFAWMYPGAYLPRFFSKRIRETEGHPTVAVITVLAWMGMRGGDSLVTALSLPHTIASGAPFPGRELIVATVFGVILATLLIQGLTLRPLIHLLKLPTDTSHEEEEALARQKMAEAGSERLAELRRTKAAPDELLEKMRLVHERRSELQIDLTGEDGTDKDAANRQKAVEEQLVRARREAVVKLRDAQVIDDEVLRHLERELDLEEMRLALLLGDGAETEEL